MLEEAFLPAVTWLAKPYQIGRHCGSWRIISVNTGGLKYLPGIDAEHNSGNFRFWHIADQRHWRKAMEDRWEEVKILSCKKYAKSITVGNHSILALSEVHQPGVARSCIRRGYGFRDRSDHQTKHKISSHYEERYLFALCKFKGLASFSRWLSQSYWL